MTECRHDIYAIIFENSSRNNEESLSESSKHNCKKRNIEIQLEQKFLFRFDEAKKEKKRKAKQIRLASGNQIT